MIGQGKKFASSVVTRMLAALVVSVPMMDAHPASRSAGDWPTYGGNAAGDRYSLLRQIDRRNVVGLKEAWRYETGEGGLQTSPLMVNGMLYGMTPTQKVFALDAATGKLIWQHDPGDAGQQPVRGLTYWRHGHERRLLTSNGTFLIALDADTGRPIESFGSHGRIDLRQGLRSSERDGATFLTSPGVLFRNLIITGFRTTETAPAASGAIRAYDVRTGRLRWAFNLIPRDGEPGASTWPAGAWRSAGGANSWAGMVVDERRGIVYAPTGSAVPDFYGADRKGDNLFANSLVALDARTGRYLWHFQGVHHDIWDRDLPSPPVLLTVRRGNRSIDAVAQPTKQGFLFVFNRVTGAPLFPIEERAVPPSDVPGETAAPTQPFPLKPAPYARQQLTPDMLTRRTPEARAGALRDFATFRSGGQFTPLTVGRQTLVFPGFDGGAEWGGPGVDRKRGVLYINSTDIAWTGGLADTTSQVAAGQGAKLYQEQCSACHGLERQGVPPDFPRLEDIGSRLLEWEIARVIVGGKGRMPGFPNLSGAPMQALVDFLRGAGGGSRELPAASESIGRSTYTFTGYRKFLDIDGYPAVQPPWGTLSAIDLNSGEYLWKVPLGRYPALAKAGLPDTGTENYGGPVVTAGGLVFIGATVYDRKLRAFDSGNGSVLWEGNLPYAGVATPITYLKNDRQFVVIATSGQRDSKGPRGSAYVAFALQEK
jgi:quinoprotein glucose dehydrogenase